MKSSNLNLLHVVLLLLASLLLLCYEASVLTYLWGWFAVPAFGLSGLAFSTAFGIILMVNITIVGITMAVANVNSKLKQGMDVADDAAQLVGTVLTRFLLVSWFFLLGWIVA